ncbi:hypothetical protein Q31a_02830 [Aureliella helgolandensis]|uniref:Uncharacterized protein n=2 Tax=Aureliella helgolandensis TaxID=2527968 RepID=A0A518G0F2_9BACT|nr:hypothetical protein Q31a_02830 [Aureliella helgolandensis]
MTQYLKKTLSPTQREFYPDLAESTREKLSAFSHRRWQLRSARGLACTWCIGLTLLLVAVLVDSWTVGETWRAAIAATFYVLLVSAAILWALPPLFHRTTFIDAAQRLERTSSRLRNHLLSALELSRQRDASAQSSAAFRSELQTQVADRMEAINVTTLLPWRKIQKTLASTAVATIILLVACWIPSLHSVQRIGRILLPLADLGRNSGIAIELVRPLPHAKIIPASDSIAITAKITGWHDRPPNKTTPLVVELQTRTGASQNSVKMAQRTPLATARTSADAQFWEAMLNTHEEWIEYRVVAQQSYTPWYRLQTQSRPTVTQFIKRISLPHYAHPEMVEAIEPNGNIRALIGSRIQLIVQVAPTVDVVQLVWEDSQAARSVEPQQFTQLDAQHWSTEFDLQRSGKYRVQLHDATTGLNNEFSPSYHVTALTDAPPQVRWIAPNNASLLATPHASIDLELQVQDELPVERVRGEYRINGARWVPTELPLPQQPEPSSPQRKEWNFKAAIPWKLDLLPLQLTSGDTLEVKISAIDAMEQTGVSEILHIALSSTSVSLHPSPSQQFSLKLADQIDDIASKLAQQAEASNSVPDEHLYESLDGIRKDLEGVLSLAEQAIVSSEDSLERAELAQVAECLAKLHSALVAITSLRASTESIPTAPATAENKTDPWFKQVDSLAQQAGTLAHSFRMQVSYVFTQQISMQISRLAETQQQILADSIASDTSIVHLVRRQAVLGLQLTEIQQAIADSLESTHEVTAEPLRLVVDQLSIQTAQIERVSEDANLRTLRHNAQGVATNLAALTAPSSLVPNIRDALQASQLRIQQLAGSVANSLLEFPALTQQTLASNTTPPSHREIGSNNIPAMQLALRRSLQRAAHAHRYSSDLGAARRAWDAIFDSRGAHVAPPQDPSTTILQALRILESQHKLSLGQSLLARLVESENEPVSKSSANRLYAEEASRWWEAHGRMLQFVADELRSTNIPQNLTSRFAEYPKSASFQEIDAQLTARCDPMGSEPSVSLALPLKRGLQEVEHLTLLFQPYVDRARQRLNELSPSLNELARHAAEATRELATQTDALAKTLESAERLPAEARLDQLQQLRASASHPIEELREALSDSADVQDLLQREQIEVAQRADRAREVVEQVAKTVAQSLDNLSSIELAQRPLQQLQQAAQQQLESSQTLDAVAEYLLGSFPGDGEGLELNELPASNVASDSGETQEPSEGGPTESSAPSDIAPTSGLSSADYAQAQALANLAHTDPQELMRQLENELKQLPPMQRELSQLSQQAVELAFATLETATALQATLAPQLQQSDPVWHGNASARQLAINSAREQAHQLLKLLLSESRWTAGSAKEQATATSLREAETLLQQTLEFADQSRQESSLELLNVASEKIHRQLQAIESVVQTAHRNLLSATERDIHRTPTDLVDRRREMKDRGRRIQQQLARNAQQLLKLEQQQLPSQGRERSSDMYETQQRRIAMAEQRAEKINQLHWTDFPGKNPAAALGAQLTQLLEEELASILHELAVIHPLPDQTWSSGAALSSAVETQHEIQQQVEFAIEELARAARHEQRLLNMLTARQLGQATQQTTATNQQEIQASVEALAAAIASTPSASLDNMPSTSRPSSTDSIPNNKSVELHSSTAAVQASRDAVLALQAATDALRQMRPTEEQADRAPASPASESNAGNPSSSAESLSSLLDASELARMLDELDQQQHADLELGENEDDATGQPSSVSPTTAPPTALSEAAQELAHRMSQSRQPPSQDAPSDLGMATDSNLADVNPHPPVPVQVLAVERADERWGYLPTQSAEEAIESRRETVLPLYRQQIEAYFRELARKPQRSAE